MKVQRTEPFTFEKLGIYKDMDDKALKKVIDEIFQAWLREKLNISFSIVVNEDKNR